MNMLLEAEKTEILKMVDSPKKSNLEFEDKIRELKNKF